jgi:hypothetical protein
MSDQHINGRRQETFLDDKTSSEAEDPERQSSHCEEKDKASKVPDDLKLDSTGLPLVPQPSRFKDDPLVSSHLLYLLYTLNVPYCRKPIVTSCAWCNRILATPC